MRRTNQKGVRWIGGREFLLCGRESDKVRAQSVAKVLRGEYMIVRIVKIWECDYMLYVHGKL